MTSEDFMKHENIEMLWEIILDKDKHFSQMQMDNIQKSFMEELIKFNDNTKNKKINLMNLNKEFIYVFINKLLHQTKQQIIPAKEEKQRENITFEDIQNERMNSFERELTLKKNDFEQFMTTTIPEQPNFKDAIDEPINGMEELIARTLAQRNFEIEQIQQPTDKKEVEKWLKGEETSLKIEKVSQKTNGQLEQKLKYIKIGEEVSKENIDKNIIDIAPKKNISWGTNTMHILNDNINNNINNIEDTKNSIFSKLKQMNYQENENDVYNKYIEIKEDVNKLNIKINNLSEQMNTILSTLSILMESKTNK